MTALAMVLLAAALVALPAVRRASLPRPAKASSGRSGSRSIPAPVLAGLLGVAVALTVGGTGGAITGAVTAGLAYAALRRSSAKAARDRNADPADLDGVLIVAALLLRAGSPPERAVADAVSVFPVPAAPAFERVARLVAMGHPPQRAWQEVARDPQLRPIASAAVRSSASGAALADAWTSIARQLRADRDTRAEVRASRAGIGVLAPLGLCFLPAFVCIGIVPIVVGLAGDIFG